MTTPTPPSTDYHDYVFRNGRLIGDFEGMYRHAADVPWHQDRAAFGVTAEIDLALLRDRPYARICDVGCGLGHFSARLAGELGQPAPAVTGLDIADTAVAKARAAFPALDFAVADLLAEATLPGAGSFDLVVARGLIWYVVHDLDLALARLAGLAAPSGRLLVTLPFPPGDRWVGQDLLPTPEALVERLSCVVAVEHWSVERNAANGFVPTVHVLGPVRTGSEGWS